MTSADDEKKIALLYPKFQDFVLDFMNEVMNEGISGGIFEGLRSYAKSDTDYAQGRTTAGQIITNAKGGQSWHNFGLAIDFVFIDKHGWTWKGDFNRIGKIAKKVGLEWGGSWAKFPDSPHVQKTFGEDIRKLDYIYRNSVASGAPLHAVWKYLDRPK